MNGLLARLQSWLAIVGQCNNVAIFRTDNIGGTHTVFGGYKVAANCDQKKPQLDY